MERIDSRFGSQLTGRAHTARLARMGGIVVLAVSATLAGCRTPDEIAVPSATLVDLQVRQYSGGIARVDALLEIDNRNDFALSLVGADVEIRLADTPVGRLRWSGETPLAKNGATRATLPAEWEVGDNGDVFTALIDRRSIAYALNGELMLARGVLTRTAPIAASGQLIPD